METISLKQLALKYSGETSLEWKTIRRDINNKQTPSKKKQQSAKPKPYVKNN